jgi:hypothetical protein
MERFPHVARWFMLNKSWEKWVEWFHFTAKLARRKIKRVIDKARRGTPRCTERKPVQLAFKQLEIRYVPTYNLYYSPRPPMAALCPFWAVPARIPSAIFL